MDHEFYAYLLPKGLRTSTTRELVDRYTRVQNALGVIDSKSLDNYLIKLKQRGIKNSYLNRLITAVKHYGEFTNNKELINIKSFPEPNTVTSRSILNLEELKSLMAVERSKEQPEERYQMFNLFFALLATTGCRPGELASLSTHGPNTVDIGNKLLLLNETKTVGRSVPIPDFLIPYCQERIGLAKNGILFPVKSGLRPISNHEWGFEFRSRLRKIGVSRPGLSCYSIRHSYITFMIDKTDINIFELKALVGHRRTSTTEIYYHHSKEKLRNASNKNPIIQESSDPYTKLNLLLTQVENSGETIKSDNRFIYTMVRDNDGFFLKVKIINP